MFSTLSKTKIIILSPLILSSANAFNLELSKILLFGKELIRCNTLPNDKILAWSKLNRYPDNKLNIAIMMICAFDRVGNNMGKGKNAGYQHFLRFP